MSAPKVEILEHTADLAVRITADDYRSLFVFVPKLVYNLIGQIVIDSQADSLEEKLSLKSADWEELFHDWLTEILYWFEVREIIFENCEFSILKPERLDASISCRKIDIYSSKIHTEIKAVTYHNLRIEEKNNKIEANVIFDI